MASRLGKKRLFLVWSCLVSILPGMAQTEKLIDYVNPFVGTDGYGNVYPGAQIPFGGIQMSPDTDSKYYDAASGYKYNHSTLLGFSLTHLSGTGIPDLGDFLFIPGTGEMKLDPGTREEPEKGYRSRYSHEKEWASPNYYAVELSDYGVKAEMTSGVRSGMFRFTYPQSDKAFIMIDMNHTLWQSCEWANLRMENDSTITGYKLVKGWGPERHIYFTATFSKKLTGLRFMQNKKPVIYNTSRFRSSYEAWGKNLMACISFDTKAGEEVDVNFNCNVVVGSDGVITGAQGGHPDTAAGAKCTIVLTPLLQGRIPAICTEVTTVTTPGESVDVVITEYGVAVNPLRKDLLEAVKNSGLPLKTIEELRDLAYRIAGEPEKVEFGERVVGIIESRDGTIMDVVRQIKPFRFKEEKNILPEPVHK